jgi:hypothetical protein
MKHWVNPREVIYMDFELSDEQLSGIYGGFTLPPINVNVNAPVRIQTGTEVGTNVGVATLVNLGKGSIGTPTLTQNNFFHQYQYQG